MILKAEVKKEIENHVKDTVQTIISAYQKWGKDGIKQDKDKLNQIVKSELLNVIENRKSYEGFNFDNLRDAPKLEKLITEAQTALGLWGLCNCGMTYRGTIQRWGIRNYSKEERNVENFNDEFVREVSKYAKEFGIEFVNSLNIEPLPQSKLKKPNFSNNFDRYESKS